VDGVLISLSKETGSYEHLESLHAKHIPVVFFDRFYDNFKFTKVTVNDYEGAFKATEHLIEQGCRRIAHLTGPRNLSIGKRRLQGYLHAMEKYGLQPDEELVRHSSLLQEDVLGHTKKLLDLPNPIDGLFTINDSVAMQTLLMMKEKGVKIPEDIALVGFTNEPASAFIHPSLTTLSQPAFQMGQLAATHLIEQIENPDDFIPQTIELKADLVVRNSSQRRAR
jgi:DNA-binding LacI/PurR family transcriptional regulator